MTEPTTYKKNYNQHVPEWWVGAGVKRTKDDVAEQPEEMCI